MSEQDEHDEERDEARDRVARDVFDRASKLDRLTDAVEGLDQSVTSLYREVRQNVPRRDEVDRKVALGLANAIYRRRIAIIGVLFIMFTAMQLKDIHNESCGPGARVEPALHYVAETPIAEYERDVLRERLRVDTHDVCDVVLPTHTHHFSEGWPNKWNVVGILFYLLVFGAMYLWLRWPISISPEPPPPGPPVRWNNYKHWNGEHERRNSERRQADDDYEH